MKMAIVHMHIFGEGVGFSFFLLFMKDLKVLGSYECETGEVREYINIINCFSGKQRIGYRALHRFPRNVKEEQP